MKGHDSSCVPRLPDIGLERSLDKNLNGHELQAYACQPSEKQHALAGNVSASPPLNPSHSSACPHFAQLRLCDSSASGRPRHDVGEDADIFKCLLLHRVAEHVSRVKPNVVLAPWTETTGTTRAVNLTILHCFVPVVTVDG